MIISAVLAMALTGLSSSCARSSDTMHDKALYKQKDTGTSMKVEENNPEMPDTGTENDLPDKSNTGSEDATAMDISSFGGGTASRSGDPAGLTGSQNDPDVKPIQNVTEITDQTEQVDERKVRKKYKTLISHLIKKRLMITTMESCTSGQIASLITDTEGASAVFKGAFVTYSNDAKVRQGVPAAVIDTYGVYSAETAAAMAASCRDTYSADFGVGVTGSFGNIDPNNADSLPGDVYFSIATGTETLCYHCRIPVQNSRLKYKLYVADVIADQLLKMI